MCANPIIHELSNIGSYTSLYNILFNNNQLFSLNQFSADNANLDIQTILIGIKNQQNKVIQNQNIL